MGERESVCVGERAFKCLCLGPLVVCYLTFEVNFLSWASLNYVALFPGPVQVAVAFVELLINLTQW